MSLRARLLLGYGYLVALLLLASGSGLVGFVRLSSGIELVLEENYGTIEAAMRMIELLERQDSATLAALLDEEEALDPGDPEAEFRRALEAARANVTEEEEGPILEEVERGWAAFLAARDELLSAAPERPLSAYRERVFPRFAAVKGDVLKLLAINQGAMIEAEREARDAAVQGSAWLGLLVAVALVSLVFLSRALRVQVLDRLVRLARDMEEVVRGDTTRRLGESGDDELGLLARRVDELLDHHHRRETALAGRLAEERRRVLGLISARPRGTVLLSVAGERLAGEKPEPEIADAVSQWIRREGRERIREGGGVHARVDTAGGAVLLTLLVSRPGHPVGWLATPEE